MNIGKPFKGALQWIAALAIGFFVVNFICFFYERPVGWISTDQGASISVWHPGTYYVNGTEGYAVTKIDRYGYTNEDKPLGDSYILVMGSSHSQGKGVDVTKRYPTLVNSAVCGNNEKLGVFSIASDRNYLPSLINHFDAACKAYPNASAIVIEIKSVDYPSEEIISACQQAVFDPSHTVALFGEQSLRGRANNFLKEYFPLITLIRTQSRAKTVYGVVEETPEQEYAFQLSLSAIRAEFDGDIVFLYHPETALSEDGNIQIVYSNLWNAFQKACGNNNIDVIDLGPAFEREYHSSYRLPYGFANTTPGKGHFNEVGHRIAADAINEYLEVHGK